MTNQARTPEDQSSPIPRDVVLVCTEPYACGSVSVTLTFFDRGAPTTIEKFGAEEWAFREAARALELLLTESDLYLPPWRLVFDCCSSSWVADALSQVECSKVWSSSDYPPMRGTLVEMCGEHSKKVNVARWARILQISSSAPRSTRSREVDSAKSVVTSSCGGTVVRSRWPKDPGNEGFDRLPRYEQMFRELSGILE